MAPSEQHRSHLGGWLRAAVLGANDGIVSIASLVLGVAAAEPTPGGVLVAGLAGLVGGALSMAAGEYVSVSSQRDVELADLARERAELASTPEAEHAELVGIYVKKGLSPALAEEVARTLVRAEEPLRVHAREELRLDPDELAAPGQAAVVSALSFGLLAKMLDHASPAVRAKGLELARRSARAWLASPERAGTLLVRPGAEARTGLAAVVIEALRELDPGLRRALAERFVHAIRALVDEHPDGPLEAHEPVLALVEILRRALSRELRTLVSEDDALAWLGGSAIPLRTLGATRLLESEAPLERVGLDRVPALANDPLLAVRALAHLLLRDAIPHLAAEPALLLGLVESPFRDTREASFDVLRALPLAALGLEGITVLCDANTPEAQALGRELAERSEGALDLGELLHRLAESPHRAMRRFALELAETRLRPGLVPLMRLEPFVRAVLLDTRPDREAKRRLLALLTRRGLASRGEAEHVASMLSALLRTHTRGDFDRIVAALAQLGSEHPGLACLASSGLVLSTGDGPRESLPEGVA